MISRRNIHILVELSLELNEKGIFCSLNLPDSLANSITVGIFKNGFTDQRFYDYYSFILDDCDAEKAIRMMIDLLRGAE